VTVILVPYHLDEHQPDLDYPLEPDVVATAGRPAGDVWERLGTLYSNVAAQVAATARTGGRPVVISGDCTTSLGTMAGLQRAGVDAGIVWFDAHGDVQTLETTSSGYLGGIPLRVLAGYRPELIAGRLGLRAVPESQIALVGARDLDPPEVAYLAGAQIRQLPTAGLDAAQLPGGPLYLHVDLDVIDCARAIPPDLTLRDFEEKYMMKQVAGTYLPMEIVQREKFAFHAHASPELVRRDGAWVDRYLSPSRIRREGYFNPEYVGELRRKCADQDFDLDLLVEDDVLMIVITHGMFLEAFDMPGLS